VKPASWSTGLSAVESRSVDHLTDATRGSQAENRFGDQFGLVHGQMKGVERIA